MKSFRQFLNESKVGLTTVPKYTGTNGFYAWLNVSQDSIQDVLDLLPELNLNAKDVADLHCTVMYSKKAIPVSCIDENKQMPDARFIQSVKATSLDWWEGHNKSGYLVLKLTSDNIKHLHDKWKECGAVPSYSEYSPHITIKSNIKQTKNIKKLIQDKNKMLDEKLLEIVLQREQVEDIKE